VRRFPGDNIPVVRGSALCALNGEKHEIGRDAGEPFAQLFLCGWGRGGGGGGGGNFAVSILNIEELVIGRNAGQTNTSSNKHALLAYALSAW
jgi:hypothetical protein